MPRARPERIRERVNDPTQEELLTALREANTALRDLLRRSVRRFQVIPTEYRALSMIFRTPSSTPTLLARELGITPASTTELIDRLERRSLLARRANPNDRRSLYLRLTPKGETIYLSARTAYRRSVVRVSKSMSESGRRQLVRGLRDFQHALTSAEPSRESAA